MMRDEWPPVVVCDNIGPRERLFWRAAVAAAFVTLIIVVLWR